MFLFMNIFTLFPELLSFSLFSPLLLRIASGVLIYHIGHATITKSYRGLDSLVPPQYARYTLSISRIVGGIFCVGGISIGIGLFTQGVAMLFAVLLSFFFTLGYRSPQILPLSRTSLVLIIVILLSLMLSGAGLYAVDLPL